jgi:GNAT superfamily N-acetyltransferase
MTNHTITQLDVVRWVDEIDRVLKSAYAVEAELLGVESFPPLNRDKKDILSCGNRFIGSISDNNLCGVVELEDPEFGVTETTIASMAVAPSHLRQGIGRALVRSVVEKEEGSFRVTTGTLNQPAIELIHRARIRVGWELHHV